MNDSTQVITPQSTAQLLEELQSLKQAVNYLNTQQAAFSAQRELLENLVEMARSSGQQEMLKGTLKSTLDVALRLADAERGSLFLYDSRGAITASLLTRKDATAEESTQLIGIVLDKGLAGWVSRNREIGLIVDTDMDERWVTLPNQPYIVRSALAVPIVRCDQLMGLVTLLHSEPGHFTPEHAHLMEITAEQIGLALENAQLYAQLDKTKQALENELEKGRQIQRNFLPEQLLELPDWEIAACFYPAKQVAGDFYDAFTLPCGAVALVLADVCDKGVGAALFMALFRSLIRVFASQISTAALELEAQKAAGETTVTAAPYLVITDPLQAISLTSNYIAETHSEMCMFATMFFGILDQKTGLLRYVNGGHEPPLIVNKSGIKTRLKPTGPAVGMLPNMKFKVAEIQLEPGDLLYSYTDGVPEAHCPDGSFFGEEQLVALVEEPVESAVSLVNRIYEKLIDHIAHRDQFDDITMLAVRRLEGE